MSMNVEQQKVFEKFTTKPAWMKNAILTKRGWTNPETGELLLGRRTPDWVFEEMQKLQVTGEVAKVEQEVVKEEPVVVEPVVVEPVVEAEVVEEPVVEELKSVESEEEIDISEFVESRPAKRPRGRRSTKVAE